MYRRSDSDSDPSWDKELFHVIRKRQGKGRQISEEDRLQEINECLNEGASINAVEDDKNTILHIAVKKGYKEIVKFLLEKGAKINIRNNKGETPLDLAGVDIKLVQVLIKNVLCSSRW